MNRAIAFAATHSAALSGTLASAARIDSVELARRLIVLGSAASLILAGQVLPY
jgi:hypothetical protein